MNATATATAIAVENVRLQISHPLHPRNAMPCHAIPYHFIRFHTYIYSFCCPCSDCYLMLLLLAYSTQLFACFVADAHLVRRLSVQLSLFQFFFIYSTFKHCFSLAFGICPTKSDVDVC